MPWPIAVPPWPAVASRGLFAVVACGPPVAESHSVRILFKSLLSTLALASLVSGASAQTHPARVEVLVRDSAGAPVGGSEVSVVQGLNVARAMGSTDDRGRVSLTIADVASAHDDYQLVVRKIGFARTEKFFRFQRDTMSFDVSLRRVPQELAPVVVTAEEDLKRKSYHIDAEAIANSDRVLIDATDILAKLRPDMICGRSCSPMAGVAARTRNPVRACPGLALSQPTKCPVNDAPVSPNTNVWVNGKRLRIVIPDEMAMARQTGVLAGLMPGTMTVLSEIKPEHIAEMTYVDEFDTSIPKIGAQGGLFIVLKDGVVYEPGKESYIPEEPVKAAPSAPKPSAMPDYRFRLLGVFDDQTGDPIENAFVTDLTTGTKARTTSTGTVSLAFLAEGTTPVRISKEGYEDISIAVEISASATTPLTLIMSRKK